MVLIVHHLHIGQSERIPWLCEELGVPYELKSYDRSPLMSPPALRAVHPSGSAPVIQDGDLTLAESGAIVEYVCQKHGGGRLLLPPSHPDYVHFLYWFHWTNASLVPNVMGLCVVNTDKEVKRAEGAAPNPLVEFSTDRLGRALAAMDDRLRDNEWLAGAEFTAADVMAVFPLTSIRHLVPYSLAEYPNILKYLKRVGEREAYQRAMAKSDPGLKLLLGPEAA